ncbi:ChbG/HpnK family deacetylase [Asanoa sp. NPDC049518]|uniref:carbohydrate deacetylase n=1 Tax=unclassified Asanoa TaxID=2685164 RepID=UPI00343EBEF0
MREPAAKPIIVNADDYGYTRGVSEGIRRAFTEGVLSSTTAMMNMPGVEDDIRVAREKTPALPFGAHLVLTAGRPISAPHEVPSLVDSDGMFHSRQGFFDACDDYAIDEVELEWSRQIDRLIGCGVEVDHLDSHHHSSYLHPTTARALLNLATRYGLPVRRPPAPPESHPAVPMMFEQAAVRMPDLFVGELMKGSSAEKFVDLARAVPDGRTAEFMVHPAVVDEELLRVSTYAAPRGPELETLLDPKVSAFVAEGHIVLATFDQLEERNRGRETSAAS